MPIMMMIVLNTSFVQGKWGCIRQVIFNTQEMIRGYSDELFSATRDWHNNWRDNTKLHQWMIESFLTATCASFTNLDGWTKGKYNYLSNSAHPSANVPWRSLLYPDMYESCILENAAGEIWGKSSWAHGIDLLTLSQNRQGKEGGNQTKWMWIMVVLKKTRCILSQQRDLLQPVNMMRVEKYALYCTCFRAPWWSSRFYL